MGTMKGGGGQKKEPEEENGSPDFGVKECVRDWLFLGPLGLEGSAARLPCWGRGLQPLCSSTCLAGPTDESDLPIVLFHKVTVRL